MGHWSLTAYVVPTEHRRLNEFVGLLLLTVSILLGLSLISYDPADPSLNISANPRFETRPSNFVGLLGSYLADLCFQGLGFSSYLVPVFIGIYAFYWLASWQVASFWTRLSGMLLLMLTLSAAFSIAPSLPLIGGQIPYGGLLGRFLADGLETTLNPAGSIIVLITTFLVSLFLATTFSFAWAIGVLKPRFQFVAAWVQRWEEYRADRAREKARQRSAERKAPRKQVLAAVSQSKEPQNIEEPRKPKPVSAPVTPIAAAPEALPVPPRPRAAAAPAPAAQGSVAEFPPTTLLHTPAAQIKVNEDELRNRARLIEEKAREFLVEGVVQQIHPGPVVTTFEFKPEAGVKYSRITALGDDLCLALEAESVRIDRIPGKSTVGIEVPNDERATIVLRELLESSEYTHHPARLPLALGKDITGKIVASDLQKMPHLLAAGSTGTGKSVSINAMILSLLFRSRPDQVKMILIDPKRLELGLYQDIPHLLVPVVTEPKIAQNALRWAVTEMENRYKKLAKRGVRNLEAYNEQVKQLPIPGLKATAEEEDEYREPIPYIVIVIDELADLMMTAAREVEESITRLAQMARAVGIHLILATQRPSVDVITGLIKANFPARISFRVASKVDSRTILDSNGAEHLLGRGDMLFLPPGSSRLMRVHGPLITEEEVIRVVEFLKQQGKPTYNERILESPEERDELGEFSGEVDELYDDAVRIVMEMGKASTSALQRRLRIGYGRAASLLDSMERDGIIGPPEGSKPRAVLINKQDYFSE
jgi:S-DNA-T family DNA segregation ATPase FtsK/SpoIIIE